MESIITKEFIADLKKADCVVIWIENGTAKIKLEQKEQKNYKTGWIKPEQQKFYNGFFASVSSGSKACHVALFKDSSNWQALQHIIKAGDEITFRAVENGSQLTREKGLHTDEIIVSITRGNKRIFDRFVLAYSVGLNNSARMIQ